MGDSLSPASSSLLETPSRMNKGRKLTFHKYELEQQAMSEMKAEIMKVIATELKNTEARLMSNMNKMFARLGKTSEGNTQTLIKKNPLNSI